MTVNPNNLSAISEEAKAESKAKAEELAKNEELVNTVQERLNKTFDLSTPEEKTESAVSTPISSAESVVDSTPTSSVTESAESTVSSVTESAESVASSVTKPADKLKSIPDAYFRAAVHQGWKPDEIKELYKQNPELANKTFSRLYDSTNQLSRDFAAIGRTKQEQTTKQQTVVPKPGEQRPEFKGVDIEKLRKEYDNDPLVDVVAQLQEQNKLLFEQVQKVPAQSTEQTDEQTLRLQIQEEQLVQKEITSFFKDTGMKPYKEFYGDVDWDKLPNEQKANRWSVVELADQIITGAEAQGRKMNVDEALMLAHLSISEPLREQIIREQIKSDVVKRNKSLTLKPNSSKPAENIKPTTRNDLETITAQRLAKTFSKM